MKERAVPEKKTTEAQDDSLSPGPQPPFKFLEHVTDAEIEAYGRNLNEAFENAGKATEETMVDLSSIHALTKKHVEVEGKDLETLLYSWLEALISLQDTEQLIFSKFDCNVSKVAEGFKLSADALGEKFDPSRHEQKTAIKSPTYHAMQITQDEENKVTVRFLLDL